MPRSHRRHHHHHHRPYRDRSRLTLLLSRQQRKTLLTLIGGCILYSYAFFQLQPDRSFEAVKRHNDEMKIREKLRQEQIQAKRNGQDLDEVPEVADVGPDWQRKMRASSAGDLAWKREQEQLAAAGHSNLRGSEGDRKRRKRSGPDALVDFILMMSVFVITRAFLRACLFYRDFNRILRSHGGIPPPPPIPILGLTGRSNNNNNNNGRSNNDNNNNNNNGRSNLARLMVPQSIHYAALLRNARFREWVSQLNSQRATNGQPPLSMDTLRVMMRDSDFSGNDYDALMRFHEEATLAESMGATQAEIDRCPQRTILHPQDDLLTTPDHAHVHIPSERHMAQECPICLDAYRLQDQVRRLPCFHEFHVRCIDPWLSQQAVCPVCKHPVLG